ncbi:MAG: glycosyltransferase family 2 protein [Halobacteriota archaeon]
MSDLSVSVVIPAYNEADRIRPVVEALSEANEVLVVDDASTDDTAAVAKAAGATVISHTENQGYIAALKDGFRAASGAVTVTMDADGEHRPADIPRLIEPIRSGEADVVFGARDRIPRPSERLLNRLAGLAVDISDTGTGFRALRTSVAEKLALETVCTCGTLALEAKARGAKLAEVPTPTAAVDKPRSIAWGHLPQLVWVGRWLWRVREVDSAERR